VQTIVVGGGLLGLATAHALVERGVPVRVIEAREGPGLETSFANGGMLTPSLPEPWNGPGIARELLTSLFDPAAAVKLRLRAVPSLLTWGVRFLANSSHHRHLAATRDNFLLARYSLERTLALTTALSLDYDLRRRGTMCIFEKRREARATLERCRQLAELGLAVAELDADAVVDAEPVLAAIRERIACGIRLPDDAHGDAHRFCQGLATAIAAAGGVLDYNTSVLALDADGDSIRGVRSDRGLIPADRVVVAAGVRSPALLATVGCSVGVQPAKGYSLTIECCDPAKLPSAAILDHGSHAVLTALGSRLRVAGTAEFAGFDQRLTPARIATLHRAVRRVLPAIAERATIEAKPWAGLRPLSHDGRPFIGGVGVPGLYVNTGHGALGWTMAAGSGAMLADLVCGRRPDIDPGPFDALRR